MRFRPEKTINKQVPLIRADAGGHLYLDVLQQKLREDPEFNLEDVSVSIEVCGGYDEDQEIVVTHHINVENPNYEKELEAYERHVREQIEEKIIFKAKARDDLLRKAAMLDREIENMKKEKIL